MTAIPDNLLDFDFCSSIASCTVSWLFRELARIGPQRNFDSLAGRLAADTTELSLLNDMRTIDTWPAGPFQRARFGHLVDDRLILGDEVSKSKFNTGPKQLRRFIGVPNCEHNSVDAARTHFAHGSRYLKLRIDGFASTCFGPLVKKGL